MREDGRDKRLSLFIGPKLYEANWMDLTRAGYLANVQVAEVWCPMTAEFYREYERANTQSLKKALAVMNPTKCAAMDYLLHYHEDRGDKIIVFSESVTALRLYAEHYQCLSIEGATRMEEREAYIRAFKTPGSDVNKLFLSRVGDVALDVPDANVIIQISSHYGSRLQEAQRMGRILRRGTSSKTGANAFFYTLISTDTLEVYHANKRRRYLVDQGYAYKVVMSSKLVVEGEEAGAGASAGMAGVDDEDAGLARLFGAASFLSTRDQQLKLLEQVLAMNVEEAERGEDARFRDYDVDVDEAARGEADALAAELLAPPDREAVDEALVTTFTLGGVVPPASSAAAATQAATMVADGGGAGASLRGTRSLVLRPSSLAVEGDVRTRTVAGMAALSGGVGLRYIEYTADTHAGDRMKAADEAVAVERKAAQALAAAKAAPASAVGAGHIFDAM